MRRRQEELDALDLRVVVVTFEAGPAARRYVRETELPFAVLVDEDRVLYREMEMERGSFWDVWGPRTLLRYARLILKGRKPRPTAADTRQLGGDVLVDPSGTIAMHHVGRGPADRPAIDEIVSHVTGGEGSH